MKPQSINPKLASIGLAALKGSVEALMIFPLLLIIGVYLLLPLGMGMWLWLAIIPLLYAVGFTVNTLLPLSRWYQLQAVVILLGAISAYLLCGQSYTFFIIFPFACLFIYRGARMVTMAWSLMFPVSYYLVGLLIYFIASVFLQFVGSFEPYVPLLTWLGLLALSVALLMSNQTTMKQETLSGDKEAVVATVVVRQNRFLVAMVLVFIVLVVFFRKLQAALNWLKEQLIAWLRELLNRPTEAPPVDPAKPAPQPPMDLGPVEPPALWLQWLEKALMVIIVIALVLGLLYLLYIAAQKLPPLVKRLFAWLNQIFNRTSQRQKAVGYEDDVESLMDWKGINNKLTSKVKKWISGQFEQKPQWQAMDRRERVRYLYRQWLRKHTKEGYPLQKHMTPAEVNMDIAKRSTERQAASTSSLIELYEQARYSDSAPSEDKIETLKKTIETKTGNKQ
ncbi:DUF4129 domain-containing protein [Paenibacillus agricola]|uniref:DUF4129 domain-containing protein n=1 Tax=Paenibacillus agricola TaxID=2716264 RepID=A0ABX0J348_9BACL|nr:DUF4129 domain-containing protein [Paenibacillus agricola]NHN30572.1 DUF4129 domain-containing protein [Paenibacillus agricola]